MASHDGQDIAMVSTIRNGATATDTAPPGTTTPSPSPSPFAHLSVARFSDLIRTIDSASTGKGKRRRIDMPLKRTQTAASRPLGIADWAKARAEIRWERNAIGDVAANRKTVKNASGKSLSNTNISSPSSSSHSSSYAPFSKPRLLERIASYSLSSYSVRVSISPKTLPGLATEEAQKALASLAAWLEPVGPALNGWTHLAARQPVTISPDGRRHVEGGKNVLLCPTCTSTLTIAADIDDVGLLFQQVSSLQAAHQHWCPWTRRSCHPSLYALQGVEEGFVARLSRTKARRVFRGLVDSVEAIVGSDLPMEGLSGIDEEDLKALQSVLLAQLSALGESHGIDGKTAVPSTPSLAAIQLALCGWLPASTSSLSSKGGTPLPSTGILQCRSCSRKLITSSAARTRAIHPLREHRRFCPWIQEEVQGGSYLPPFSLITTALSEMNKEGDPVEEGRWQSDKVATLLEAYLESMQHHRAKSTSSRPTSSSSTSSSGWQLNLHTLLPSNVPTESIRAKSIPSLDPEAEDDETTTRGLTIPHRSDQQVGGGIKRKRTSEILTQARSLLFGTGGGTGVTGGGMSTRD